MIDLHAHVLPALDDGPHHWGETLAGLKQARQAGVTTLVAAVHANDPIYHVSASLYRAGFTAVQTALAGEKIAVHLIPGMEVRLDRNLAAGYRAGKFLAIGDSGYFCVELPPEDFPAYTFDSLFTLALEGVRPFLIHPERHLALQKHSAWRQKLLDMQIPGVASLGSLMGQFGPAAEAAGWAMIDQGLIVAVASDGHSIPQRPYTLDVASALITERYGDVVAYAMTTATPRAMLRGEPLDSARPRSEKRRAFPWRLRAR